MRTARPNAFANGGGRKAKTLVWSGLYSQVNGAHFGEKLNVESALCYMYV